jgi:phosphoenolpyruvate-protein phosphotransferase (PTS system enzyme I)
MTLRLVARGIGASPGIAYGRALVLRSEEIPISYVSLRETDLPLEISRFQNAASASKRQLQVIQRKVAEALGEDHARFLDAQIMALDDPLLIKNTVQNIREHRVNAEWAAHHTVSQIARRFADMNDPYLSERVKDIEDVLRRVIQNLMGMPPKDLMTVEEPHILVASRLAPSEAIQLRPGLTLGLALDAGGMTAHTAIIARSMGIPAVIGLHSLSASAVDRTHVIVDGSDGAVILNPADADVEACRRKKVEIEKEARSYASLRDEPAATRDGHRVRLMANIEFPTDVETASGHGAEGVGLYRTEFLYLNKSPQLPTEEDHYQDYRKVLEGMAGHRVIIRTLDLGGEKFFHSVLQKDNFNPVLGLRAIRYCLKNEDVFRAQLRGLLRASAHGDLHVMVPMVTTLDEVREVKALLARTREELRAEGKPVAERIPFGIMVELPAVAVAADLFAAEADFFSVGTNDLIQYTLAIERGNDSVAYLYDPLHPAVLRLLDGIARAARKAGIGLHLCGEMASDPLFTELLLGLGYLSLSMNARRIPAVKVRVREMDLKDAKALAKACLKSGDAAGTRALLESRMADGDGAVMEASA